MYRTFSHTVSKTSLILLYVSNNHTRGRAAVQNIQADQSEDVEVSVTAALKIVQALIQMVNINALVLVRKCFS